MEDVMFRSELIKAAFADELSAIFKFKSGMTKQAVLIRVPGVGVGQLVGEAVEALAPAEAELARQAARGAARAVLPEAAEQAARGTTRTILPAAEGAAGGTTQALAPAATAPMGPAADAASEAARGGLFGRMFGGAGEAGVGAMQRLRPWLAPLAAGGIGYALTGNPLVGLLAGGGMAAAGRLGRGAARLAGRGGENVTEMATRDANRLLAEGKANTFGEAFSTARRSLDEALGGPGGKELAARMAAADAPRYGLGLGVGIPAALGAGYFGLRGAKNLLMGDQPNNLGTIPSLALGGATAYGTHRLLQDTNIPFLQNPLAQYGLPLLAGMAAPQFASSMIG